MHAAHLLVWTACMSASNAAPTCTSCFLISRLSGSLLMEGQVQESGSRASYSRANKNEHVLDLSTPLWPDERGTAVQAQQRAEQADLRWSCVTRSRRLKNRRSPPLISK